MYNIRRGSNLRFSDHMSSLKTALRSSDTCLILDFSTTRSSSTFWGSLRKLWIKWDDVRSYDKREEKQQWSRALWDLESDLGFWRCLWCWEWFWISTLVDSPRLLCVRIVRKFWVMRDVICFKIEIWGDFSFAVLLLPQSEEPRICTITIILAIKMSLPPSKHSRSWCQRSPCRSSRWAGRCPSRHSRSSCPPSPASSSAPGRVHDDKDHSASGGSDIGFDNTDNMDVTLICFCNFSSRSRLFSSLTWRRVAHYFQWVVHCCNSVLNCCQPVKLCCQKYIVTIE